MSNCKGDCNDGCWLKSQGKCTAGANCGFCHQAVCVARTASLRSGLGSKYDSLVSAWCGGTEAVITEPAPPKPQKKLPKENKPPAKKRSKEEDLLRAWGVEPDEEPVSIVEESVNKEPPTQVEKSIPHTTASIIGAIDRMTLEEKKDWTVAEGCQQQ